MSSSFTQMLPLLLAVGFGLSPQAAEAFAFDTAMEPSSVLLNQTTGSPIVWAHPQVVMSVNLGSVPPGTTLANGTTSWDANAAEAVALWNTVVPNFFTMDTTEADPCDRHNGINTVTFAHDHCGDSFGDAVAVTRKSFIRHSGHCFLLEADVVLNAQLCWNAYAGPLRPCTATLGLAPELDIQRVILHELGHVLGLEHPDDAGQTEVAIMNSHISNVDTLMQDDRDGAVFLYSQSSSAALTPTSSDSGGGGGCTLRPGMGVDPTLGAVLLLLVVRWTWKRTRWARVRVKDCCRAPVRFALHEAQLPVGVQTETLPTRSSSRAHDER
jgi:hypothetical protein